MEEEGHTVQVALSREENSRACKSAAHNQNSTIAIGALIHVNTRLILRWLRGPIPPLGQALVSAR